MRTNINLNDELIAEAFRYAKVKTKKQLVELTLKEFVQNHRRKDIRELRGVVHFSPDYNYKKLREE
jgi:Arc/MetJ family transcription regulator